MEWKIGEIFEYNGEWYQCVECDSCGKCSLRTTECRSGTKSDLADEVFGECSKIRRSDYKYIIFKKLEKVGEPFTLTIHVEERLVLMQEYKLYDVNFCKENALLMYVSDYKHKRIAIEIKQTKEDMKEKDIKPYDKIFSEGTVSNTENLVTSSLKPFDLEAAKAGNPVCTRDGRKARIICFDTKGSTHPIVALIEKDEKEVLSLYMLNGKKYEDEEEWKGDLMMLPEKKSGWMNVYKERIYDTKEGAIKAKYDGATYIDTIKISWEE